MKTAGRVALGVLLAWYVASALIAPELPHFAAALAAAVFGATLWRPDIGLVAVIALTPAGLMLASPPVRAAELMTWAFLAGWLLRVWQPLAADGWPRDVAGPALLYGLCVIASWKAVMIAGAAGVDSRALPSYLAHAIRPDFLVFSSGETQTWTMVQAVTGLALLLAAQAVGRTNPGRTRCVAYALVIAMTLLGVATCISVYRQWNAAGYDVSFLLRYTRGERFTLHLSDLNAAGSQYVLAAGVALALAIGSRRRWMWAALLLVMMPAFWLTGSRSAFAALAGAAATIAVLRRPTAWRLRRAPLLAATAVVLLIVISLGALAMFGSDERGSAGRALRLRTQFLQTSVHMFAAAPLFGVGVGRYFDRSPEFMPPDLKALYGAENAHDYFAQQFAEVGLLGGSLFIWLIAAALVAGWRRARKADRDPFTIALMAGCTGYVLTCMTGHPFLVSEAALPFWGTLGMLVSTDTPRIAWRPLRTIALIVIVLVALNVGMAWRAYAGVTTRPPTTGIDASAVAPDGRPFSWAAPHLTTYMPAGPGFLRMTLRAPDVATRRPFTVETLVAGRVVDRRALPRGEWVTLEIPIRTPASGSFRRIDLVTTPFWTEQRRMARRTAPVEVALGVMVAELRWITPEGR